MAVWLVVAVLVAATNGAGSGKLLQTDGPAVDVLHRKVTELCVQHCEALLKDTSMCAAKGEGFCRFVTHLTADNHLREMAAEVGRVRSIDEQWETVLDWAVKDLVTAKHNSKTEDDHAMVLLLMEHVTEVVGSMFAFHEHSENL